MNFLSLFLLGFEKSKTLTFQGNRGRKLGMSLTIEGIVDKVREGTQAYDLGVCQGWKLVKIDSEPFDRGLLKMKNEQEDEMKLGFVIMSTIFHKLQYVMDEVYYDVEVGEDDEYKNLFMNEKIDAYVNRNEIQLNSHVTSLSILHA